MKLTLSEQNKLIDVIVLLNQRFTKLFSHAFSITRLEYANHPFIKVKLDKDKDHENFLIINFNFNLATNNLNTNKKDYSLYLKLPKHEFNSIIQKDSSYEIAEELQNFLIIQLINNAKHDDFIDKNITNNKTKAEIKLKVLTMINFIIQTILNSHYTKKLDIIFLFRTIDKKKIVNSLDQYHKIVYSTHELLQSKTEFLLENNEKSKQTNQLIKNEINNQYHQIKQIQIHEDEKTFIKLAIKSVLLTYYIDQNSKIIETIEQLADFIYYSQPKIIKQNYIRQ